MLSKPYAAAAAAAMLCASPAFAGTGTSEFLASIRADGTIRAGSGVSSSSKLATGRYEVNFPRDISQCIFVVTSLSSTPNTTVARVTNSFPQRVLVYSFINAATVQDVGFNLLVKCQD